MANTNETSTHDTPHPHNDDRGKDLADGRSASFLYEVKQGRRHLHGNSHATGATNIEHNQYQGPTEVSDKIILHPPMYMNQHRAGEKILQRRQEQNSEMRTLHAKTYQQPVYERPTKEINILSPESSPDFTYISEQPTEDLRMLNNPQDNTFQNRHHLHPGRSEHLFKRSPEKMFPSKVSPEKQPSNQPTSGQIFFKHSTDLECLTPNYKIGSSMNKSLFAKENYNVNKPCSDTIHQSYLSPLTVETDIEAKPSENRQSNTPFYYSQSHGPLKSPGIFVPFEDERKREIIENAIREALEREEQLMQSISQPFPLQDPPKHKIKRAISTDSNESISNRIQSYPSKRVQDVDEVDYDKHGRTPSFEDRVDGIGENNLNEGVECVSRFSEKETQIVDPIHGIDKQENMAVTYSRFNNTKTPNRNTLLINTCVENAQYIHSEETTNVPMTPYTTNLKWVISNPNPTSVNDFKAARTEKDSDKELSDRKIKSTNSEHENPKCAPLYRENSYEFHNMAEASDETLIAEQLQLTKTGRGKEISFPSYYNTTTCNDLITNDLNTYQFDRDAKPLSSASGMSAMTKVTEKGFVFPHNPVVTEPVLFSPRIVGERFKPHFESTPKGMTSPTCSPVKICTCTSPIKRTVSSPAIPSCSWQQSRRACSTVPSPAIPGCSYQSSPHHRLHYEASNQFLQYSPKTNSDSIQNDLTMRPTLSTDMESPSKSASLSNSNSSNNRQTTNSYIRNGIHTIFSPGGKLDCNEDEGHLSDLYFKREMERFFRSHSAVEISPSKKDIEKVRERVRQVYRSISNPAELKQHLKNMLAEEHMKEEFLCDNDVFESSPIKNDRMWEYRHQHPIQRRYYQQQNTLEHQYRNEEARRRLFVDPTRPTFTTLSDKRQLQHEAHRQLDLPKILSDIFSNPCDETQEYPNDNIYDEENMRCPLNERQRTDQPSTSHRFGQEVPDSRYVCEMPGCSHSNIRVPRDASRKRKRGDMELCVSCEEDDVSEKSRLLQNALQKVQHPVGKNCSCAKIESAILEMARDAYQKIRRLDSSERSFDRFNNEATETREQIFDSVKVLCGIKSMCKYGRIIEDIFTGSIVFVLNCPSILALEDLWNSYISGELTAMFNDSFLTDRLKSKFNCPKARLIVCISAEEYQRAKDELHAVEVRTCAIENIVGTSNQVKDDSGMTKSKFNTSLSKSDTEISSVCSSSKENQIRDTTRRKKVKPSALAIIHMRSQSAPSGSQSPSPSPSWMSQLSNSPFSKDKTFSFSIAGDQSPRKAFQEISTGSPTLNINSPTSKKVFDFDLTLTPKSSPKRKTLGERSPLDNENVNQVTSMSKRKSIRD